MDQSRQLIDDSGMNEDGDDVRLLQDYFLLRRVCLHKLTTDKPQR